MRTDKYMMAKAWMKQDQAPQAEALDTWNTLEAEFNEERKAMLMASDERREFKFGERIGLVEGGLLKTGPNTGKYVLRSKIDGEAVRRYFDTKKEFDEAVKISKANTGGGARDQSKRISEPTTTEIEISEKVYGDKYNKKGEELWKSLTGRERGGIRQGTTTGGKKGPTEGLAVSAEGKPNYVVKREKALKRNAPFFQKGTKDFQFHHIMNIGGEIPLDTNDIAVISKEMNIKLAPYNKKLNNIADNISDLFNNQPDGYLKKIDQLNSEGESIIKKAIKDLPKEYRNLIGFNKVVPVTDEYGTVVNIASEKIGGSNIKKPGTKLEKLTNKEATALRKQIRSDALRGNTGPINTKQIELIKNLNTVSNKGGAKGKAAAKILAILAGSTGAAAADDGSEGTSGMLIDAGIGGGAVATLGTKTGRKILMNLLNASGLPASAAFNIIYGIDPSSSLDRGILGAELAISPVMVRDALGVTNKIQNQTLKKIAQAATTISPKYAMKAARIANPIGLSMVGGEIAHKVMTESEPNYYIGKDGEPTFYDRENASDVFPSMIDANEQAYKIAKEKNISYEDALREIDMTRLVNLKNE